MRRNLGAPATRRRTGDAMAAYDRLPPDLRAWLAQAALPWSPRSALRLWHRVMRDSGGDRRAASAALSRIEARQLTRLDPRAAHSAGR